MALEASIDTDSVDTVTDLVPYVGGGKDVYRIALGKNFLTGEEVS